MTETTDTAAPGTAAAAGVPWDEFAAAEPEFAAQVRDRFEQAKHHVLATVRRSGAPRVSGTEVAFEEGGEATLGSMTGARKALDLRADPRFALHANPGSPDDMMAGGDAKIGGTAVEVTDPDALEAARAPGQPPGPYHRFLLRISEAVVTRVEGDRLVVRTWHPGLPLTRAERS
ncbi:pyridoxamine 5'-phosphate oxidase family protein [Nocardiopsis coralliicola]